MEIILRDDPGPSDDQVVVIHMGAGAVDVAVAAALRNYRAYEAFSARGGEFTVSVFAAMAGITEEMILGAMPHPQYGRARYGAVRSHFSLLATTILGTPVPDDVMAVHYDVILPTGALQLPDDFDPTEADDDLIDRIRSALNAPMAELLRLFEPRVRR
jgi:hypothetical protein